MQGRHVLTFEYAHQLVAWSAGGTAWMNIIITPDDRAEVVEARTA